MCSHLRFSFWSFGAISGTGTWPIQTGSSCLWLSLSQLSSDRVAELDPPGFGFFQDQQAWVTEIQALKRIVWNPYKETQTMNKHFLHPVWKQHKVIEALFGGRLRFFQFFVSTLIAWILFWSTPCEWVWKKAFAAIVDGCEKQDISLTEGAQCLLLVGCRCLWLLWRFILVTIVALLLAWSWHSSEGRCPEDKDSKRDHTMELLTFICINKSVFFCHPFAYSAWRLYSAKWGELDFMCQQLMKSCWIYQIVC